MPMFVRRALWLALLPIWSGAVGAAVPDGTLLVANRNGGSISFFDLPTRTEIARVPIGPVIPHEVAVSPDGRWALTAEYGPDDRRGHDLVVIDVVDARITGRIDLGAPSRPHSVVFLPGSRRAVATMQDVDRIALVDVVSRQVLRTYPTGGREGHMVRLSPDGSRAYVTSRGGDGTLSVIFLDEERPPVVIPAGKGAEGIAVTPDGSEVWAVNRLDGTISIVDTERLAVVDTIPARPYSNRAEISAAGRAVVPNGMGSQLTAQYLRVYDAGSRSVLADVPLHGDAPSAGTMGVLVVGETAFLSDRAEGRILLFDLARPSQPEELLVDSDSPDGMAWSPLRAAVLSRKADETPSQSSR
jgi:YVTN family beta-propeller protein